MKNKYLLLFILLFSGYGKTQTLDFAVNFGNDSLQSSKSVRKDMYGNVYTIGNFRGSMDFDPGPGVSMLSSVGAMDIFLLKLDPNGNFLWAKQFGGSQNDDAHSITVDSAGNVIMCGYFSDTADFDPGPGTQNLISTSYINDYICKLDASGNLIWLKHLSALYALHCTDLSGNIYITGSFTGTLDFDPGPGIFFQSSLTGNNAYVLKLNSSGDFVFAKSFGSSGDLNPHTITLDYAGNILSGGDFYGGGDFDPGPGIFNMIPSGVPDVYIQKLDPSGNFIWAKEINAGIYVFPVSIATDHAASVYLVSSFSGSVDFDPGSAGGYFNSLGNFDAFFVKLDSSGLFKWANQIASAYLDHCRSICINKNDDIYITGSFADTVDFDPGTGVSNLITAGNSTGNIFIASYDTSGSLKWVTGIGMDYAPDIGLSVFADDSGSVYASGMFSGTADFDPGPGNTTMSCNTSNLFVLKLKAPGVGTLENLYSTKEIKIYPNPAKDFFTIENISSNSTIYLYDISGRLVQSQKSTSTKAIVNTSGLSNGVFLVEVIGESERAFQRVVINR